MTSCENRNEAGIHMKNGWQVIEGHTVYVKSKRVICGIKTDNNNNSVMAFPYRKCEKNVQGKKYCDEWVECSGISIKTFQSGIQNGTISIGR